MKMFIPADWELVSPLRKSILYWYIAQTLTI